MSAKSLSAVILLVCFLAGGLYFANWLVLTFLHVDAPPAWNTWWQYFQALSLPQYAPYAIKVKSAGAIGFGVPILAWLILLIPLFKSKPESLHGDASFGGMGDAKKADLLRRTPQGLLIGKLRGRLLWLNGAQHLIMIAATRTGKTTSVAIPVLLTYQESMVVSDIKGELCKLTSGQRRAMGQRVHVWAPYDVDGRTHRFNPLTLLAGSDARTRIADIQTIAAILYPDEASKDPFWSTQARAIFTALTSFLFERFDHHIRQLQSLKAPVVLWPHPNTSEAFPSFERVLRFSAGEGGQSIGEMLESIVTQTAQYPYLSPQTRTGLSNFIGLAEQTLSSVMATMQSPLQQFLSPILAGSTNATDFDITAIRKRPTTIYVNIPTNKLDESAKLLNIFYSSVIGNNLGKQLGEEPDLKYQMVTLLDEFTAMGRLDVWAKRISISASYGVRSIVIVQSQAQLRGTYGDNDAQNLITNHGCQIVFTPREQSDANAYSEMLGNRTIRRKNRSRSSGGQGGSQISISYSEEKRPLMHPQEIKELPQDDELIFKEGCKPIRARKNWFFKDKQLTALTKLPPVVVEPLAQRLAASDAKPKRKRFEVDERMRQLLASR